MLLYAENYIVKHFDITSVTKIVVHKIGIFYQLRPFKLSFPYILYKIDNIFVRKILKCNPFDKFHIFRKCHTVGTK